MHYLIRFVQVHETFRLPELDALAALHRIRLRVLHYHNHSPFCVVELESDDHARRLVQRGILSDSVYELWASGESYDALHSEIKTKCLARAEQYKKSSFKFSIDAFRGKRSTSKQRELIESFSYLPLQGPIVMERPEVHMFVFEEFEDQAAAPKKLYFGRWLGGSSRNALQRFDLKKRQYISRTSMDAELSLVAANITLAGPGKIIFDPFVGTGSFAVAAAYFGAMAFGADIDGRSVRGTPGCNIRSNFDQYSVRSNLLDNFVADLVHCPLRTGRFLDGIICDPPYGVREGPKTLGYREGRVAELVMIDGIPAHLRDGFIAPKRPYGFDDMMYDVLDFAYASLVDYGRVSVWMPTANDENIELAIPTHPGLDLLSVCVQQFNKWARRLLTYKRLPGMIDAIKRTRTTGRNADDVNAFRKKYFQGFRAQT